MYSIYKIQNTINGKVYIGQTKRPISNRFNDHIRMAEELDSNYHIHRAIRKHGRDKFTLDLIEEVEEADVNTREMFWVNYFDSFAHGYNMTFGGEGKKGYITAAVTKQKISNTKRGTEVSKAAYKKRNATLRKKDIDFLNTIGRKSSETQKKTGSNSGKNNPRYDNNYYLLFDNNGNLVLKYLRSDLSKLDKTLYPVRHMYNTKSRNIKLFLTTTAHKFKNWHFCYEHEAYIKYEY